MIALVVINEQQHVLPDQERVLLAHFENYERVDIPAEGLSLEEMRPVMKRLWDAENSAIVFASPIPAMINVLAHWSGRADGPGRDRPDVYVFHNDRVAAQTGWVLV